MQSIWINALKNASLLVFVILIATKQSVHAEDLNSDESDAYQIPVPDEAGELAKRAWSQLHGSWGKRAPDEEEAKKSLQSYQQLTYPDSSKNFYYDLPTLNDYNLISDSDDFDGTHLNEKRAWKSMNGAWGKRNWNRFRGTGKREPGNWNNLRGLWGKRSAREPRDWNRLSKAWGK